MKKIMDKISEGIDMVTRAFITSFLFMMTIVLAIHIALRYFFQGGILWSDELSRFAMIGIVYLGAASATRDNTHMTVSIFEDRWPSLRQWLAPVQGAVMIAYSLFLIIFGIQALEVVGAQSSANIGISMGWIYSVIPISAVIMMIHILAKIGAKRHVALEEDQSW
ncbi:TRAP transporter small permease [Siminovitchia sp. FSL W7-1587]|uniref:TRAP transporter small permease n=1 Tax=Siminovitchia sp. FSL W7-1587 TaxID=2954699 RepID=UPI0030D29054